MSERATQTVSRDRRPLLAAAVTAIVSVTLLVLAAQHGWLGADVGRGSDFCEAARPGWLKQPANSVSNIGFVCAGLAVAWRAGAPGGRLERRGLATTYAVLVVLLGPGSAAMHATQTAAGGHLDTSSMYLVAGFAAAYAVMRLLALGPGFFYPAFVVFVLACEALERIPGPVPVVMSWGNVAFAGFLAIAVVTELALHRGSGRGDVRWVAGATGALALAFAIWTQAKDGGPLCHPHSLLQGHAAWHLLCAVSAWCLYRYWASAADSTSSNDSLLRSASNAA